MGSHAAASSSVKILTWVVYQPPQALSFLPDTKFFFLPTWFLKEDSHLPNHHTHPRRCQATTPHPLLGSGVLISLLSSRFNVCH